MFHFTNCYVSFFLQIRKEKETKKKREKERDIRKITQFTSLITVDRSHLHLLPCPRSLILSAHASSRQRKKETNKKIKREIVLRDPRSIVGSIVFFRSSRSQPLLIDQTIFPTSLISIAFINRTYKIYLGKRSKDKETTQHVRPLRTSQTKDNQTSR